MAASSGSSASPGRVTVTQGAQKGGSGGLPHPEKDLLIGCLLCAADHAASAGPPGMTWAFSSDSTMARWHRAAQCQIRPGGRGKTRKSTNRGTVYCSSLWHRSEVWSSENTYPRSLLRLGTRLLLLQLHRVALQRVVPSCDNASLAVEVVSGVEVLSGRGREGRRKTFCIMQPIMQNRTQTRMEQN